jgi:hypothetical protein
VARNGLIARAVSRCSPSVPRRLILAFALAASPAAARRALRSAQDEVGRQV